MFSNVTYNGPSVSNTFNDNYSTSPSARIPCSTLAMISGSPSISSMPKFSRDWSTIGSSGIDWPNETHFPSSQVSFSRRSKIGNQRPFA
jgi:hypothetical protein